MKKARVAVIDVGSNSIKALVAEAGNGPLGLRTLFQETLEVRISQGIGGQPPLLHPDRIEAGVEAVRRLWKDCQAHGPLSAMRIVATSAVRSAANGHIFTESVRVLTGIEPSILTGAEEADAIAVGVRTDPAIGERLSDYSVFDLGGGSLELIRFEHHGVTDRTSLPLGAVRLTEMFISDATRPVPESEQRRLAAYVHDHILATGMSLKPPLVGCSGGLAAVRHILAARRGEAFSEASTFMSQDDVGKLAREILSSDLTRRLAIPGMPERRADIFPAAMIVFQTLLRLSSADGILHSFHNLRYGLALRLLEAGTLLS